MNLMRALLAASAALALSSCTARVVVVPATPSAAPPAGPAASAGPFPRPAPAPAAAPVSALFPEIPPIVIPDVTASTAVSGRFATVLGDLATPVSGVSVQGARCDASGRVVNRAGLTEVDNGDGSRSFTDGSLQVVDDGSGSRVHRDGTQQITVIGNGNGAGILRDGSLEIAISGDGSGVYTDGSTKIYVSGDGAVSYTNGSLKIVNNGNGSGSYDDGTLRVENFGDGSGTSARGTSKTFNKGDGTGTVDSVPTAMPPLAPLAGLGHFPAAGALAPVGTSCGTLLRLSERILFDFARSDLQADSGPVLEKIARALDTVTGPVAVNAHTDAVGSDADNMALSQRRADAVVAALRSRGVRAGLVATAFGESQPIAPNQRNGQDDPGGRALNRRVEIVIPGS